eukprot:3520209-Amphidinium_carterae.2
MTHYVALCQCKLFSSTLSDVHFVVWPARKLSSQSKCSCKRQGGGANFKLLACGGVVVVAVFVFVDIPWDEDSVQVV